MSRLTDEQVYQVSEFLMGTCKDEEDALNALGIEYIDPNTVEDQMLDVSTERCVHCNWWHESGILTHCQEHGGGLCDHCCEELGVKTDEDDDDED